MIIIFDSAKLTIVWKKITFFKERKFQSHYDLFQSCYDLFNHL